MRFPSLAFVGSETRRVALRFPLVGVSALVAAVAGILLLENPESESNLVRLLLSASLGLPLFTALTLFAEKQRWGAVPRVILQIAGVTAVAWVYWVWPHWLEPVQIRRTIQLSVAFHLLAAFLPFIRRGELNGFWQHNRRLFIRFLISALYAGVLYVGLSIAILAMDKLFGVDVDDELYGQLWITIGFVFTTWFFLGGVSRELERLDSDETYPGGIRIFSQFILLPLVTIYMVILTLYLGKVLITGTWPSGWIGYLVSSVSVIGILSLLLVFPVQERLENRWVRTYSRWFYIILLPSVGMLLVAIFKRIEQYGVTENRYFMVVLSLWLAAISVYFIVSRTKSIKVIPFSLCLIALLTAFGPWGAYGVSSRSQTARLEQLLTETEILREGEIVPAATHGELAFDDRREISAIVHYLMETHGTEPIRDWFADGLADVDTIGSEDPRYGSSWKTARKSRAVMEKLGVPYVDRWQQAEKRRFNYSVPRSSIAMSIADYELVFGVSGLYSSHTRRVSMREKTYEVDYETESLSLRIHAEGDTLIRVPLSGAIDSTYARTAAGKPFNELEPLIVKTENDRLAVLMVVERMNGTRNEDGTTHVANFGALFFVRFK